MSLVFSIIYKAYIPCFNYNILEAFVPKCKFVFNRHKSIHSFIYLFITYIWDNIQYCLIPLMSSVVTSWFSLLACIFSMRCSRRLLLPLNSIIITWQWWCVVCVTSVCNLYYVMVRLHVMSVGLVDPYWGTCPKRRHSLVERWGPRSSGRCAPRASSQAPTTIYNLLQTPSY